MSSDPAKEVLRFLQQEVINIIEHSERGSHACAQAHMFGPLHISTILLISEAPGRDEATATFRAYVELQDDEEEQCEAELVCSCERLPGDGAVWRITALQMLDAAPLPKI
jgi:hypothetical protein